MYVSFENIFLERHPKNSKLFNGFKGVKKNTSEELLHQLGTYFNLIPIKTRSSF